MVGQVLTLLGQLEQLLLGRQPLVHQDLTLLGDLEQRLEQQLEPLGKVQAQLVDQQ